MGRIIRLPDDLANLAGNSLAFLQGLVCDLAVGGRLWKARPGFGQPPAQYQDALAVLDKLERAGYDMFRRRPVLGWLDWPIVFARAL